MQPAVTPKLPAAAGTTSAAKEIQARVASLSYLPTTAAVALKFVELGRSPEAEPADYARVISADSSLSSKLLSLANSSWAGVRNKVTTVKMAVNLLGLGTVRTLAISYCMTGLHNELRLSPAESQLFWETSLSKAVAAKRYASMFDEKAADEAFVAGLFQDFALPVIYSVLREPYLARLRDAQTDIPAAIQCEREMAGMDHAEVGRMLAQKLQLPELYVDTIAFHHDYERLSEFVTSAPTRDATAVAALLPHTLNGWNPRDAHALAEFLEQHAPNTDIASFIADVQAEFTQLYSFFHEGAVPQAQLDDLLTTAAREAADNTTILVSRINEFVLREAGAAPAHDSSSTPGGGTDVLTGALARASFESQAQASLAAAARYRTGLALAYLDLDRFKSANDECGHAFGDQVLQKLGEIVRATVPPETLFGRLGGDELVLVLTGCTPTQAEKLVEQIVTQMGANPVEHGKHSRRVTVSAGLLYLKPGGRPLTLAEALALADNLMYAAKRSGGSRVVTRVVEPAQQP